MFVGWMVEWSNSFRDYFGVVIEKKLTRSNTEDCWVILDILTLTEHEVSTSTTNIRKVRPAVLEMANYLRNKYFSTEKINLSNIESKLTIHNKVIDDISSRVIVAEKIAGVPINDLAAAKLKAIAYEKQLQRKLRSRKLRNSGGEESISSEVESVEDDCKADYEEENNSDEIDDDEGDDDDDGENDNDDDDDDENSEEEDVEDDADEAKSSESNKEAKEDDDDEDEDDDDDEVQALSKRKAVDVKVYIQLGDPESQQDIRGFCIKINGEGLKKIRSAIQRDYETQFRLFYRESDGDIITIKSSDDLKYAYRAELQNQPLKTKRNPPAVKLKLFAENIAIPPQPKIMAVSPQKSEKSVMSSSSSLPEDTIKVVNFSEKSHLLAGGDSVDASLFSSASTLAPSFGERHDGGSYELIWKRGELLGTGSFGQVYSGINLSNGDRMAVKEVVLNPGKRHKEQAKALRQEVKILSTLDHPNIIKYLGTEFKEGALRIFLELATDGTVKDALNEFGAFPEPLIRRYAADIIEGLTFLHAKLFIHRDIKPTNLLVSNGVVKLADFGCSSQYFENGTTSNAGHGTVVGTTVYMAPEVMNGECFNFSPEKNQADNAAQKEQLDGTSTADMFTRKRESGNGNGNVVRSVGPRPGYGKKADIWSVGITLTEMATAKVPFANAGAAIYCIFVSKQFPRFPNHFYEDAHNFLSRCLVEQPRGRANCMELRSHPFLARQSMEVIRAQTTSASGSDLHRKSTWSTLQATLPSNISYLDTSQSRSGWDIATRDEEICTEMGTGAMEGESKLSERLHRSADSSTLGEDTGFSGLFESDATRRRTLSRYDYKGDGNENYPDDFS